MGVILTTEASHIFIDQAILIPEDRALANHWASGLINENPAYRWVVGKYVEADRPNRNNMRWRSEDFAQAKMTVNHAPMNMLHRPHHIVGSFVGSEVVYPNATAALDVEQPPYIEAAGAFWRYYFPNELAIVEQAYSEGSLFFSMECLAETITWTTPGGSAQEFPYAGPRHESYAGWDDKANVSTLNNPLFVGGALIVPPAAPAWQGAEIRTLSDIVAENEEEAEDVYELVKATAPHLGAEVWEGLMTSVMKAAKSIPAQSV